MWVHYAEMIIVTAGDRVFSTANLWHTVTLDQKAIVFL